MAIQQHLGAAYYSQFILDLAWEKDYTPYMRNETYPKPPTKRKPLLLSNDWLIVYSPILGFYHVSDSTFKHVGSYQSFGLAYDNAMQGISK